MKLVTVTETPKNPVLRIYNDINNQGEYTDIALTHDQALDISIQLAQVALKTKGHCLS